MTFFGCKHKPSCSDASLLTNYLCMQIEKKIPKAGVVLPLPWILLHIAVYFFSVLHMFQTSRSRCLTCREKANDFPTLVASELSTRAL